MTSTEAPVHGKPGKPWLATFVVAWGFGLSLYYWVENAPYYLDRFQEFARILGLK